MTMHEIIPTFKEMYDADVFTSLISWLTDTVIEQVSNGNRVRWMRAIVYLDCIMLKDSLGSTSNQENCLSGAKGG